jgi:hypothetical protein
VVIPNPQAKGVGLARDAVRKQREPAREGSPFGQSSLFLATIVSTNTADWEASIRPTGATTGGIEMHAMVEGPLPPVGSQALCCWVGGEAVVIGAIGGNGSFEMVNLELAGFEVTGSAEIETLHVDGTATIDNLVLLNANSPIVVTSAQSSADDGTCTSTTVYDVAMSVNLVLPVGTWSIDAVGGVAMLHSAGNANRWAIEIDGVEGTARTASCPTGVAGNRTVVVRVLYRPSDAGTATAANPWILISANRTA